MSTIRNIAVLGLGTMGHGIAQAFAVGGCRVSGYDLSEEVRGSVAGRIEHNLRTAAQAGFGEETAIAPALARFRVCETEAEAVQGAEFVVEAVAEDLEVKRQLFSRIESRVSAETILASNTSSFPISDIAADLIRPRRALITHWFNPPHIVPLVEVVPGEKTGAEAVEATLALLRQVEKSPVRLKKEVPGFLVNRIQIAMLREILDLLDRGVGRSRGDRSGGEEHHRFSPGRHRSAGGHRLRGPGCDRQRVREPGGGRPFRPAASGGAGTGGPVGPFRSQERSRDLPLHPGGGASEGVGARPPFSGAAAPVPPGIGTP